ncbi:MAG: SDR family NAD(P)-dependent oxidoreductase [Verrucomicrobiales bacterium]
MHCVVTGGAGFIGSHLVEKLVTLGHQVTVLDDFNDYYNPEIKHQNLAAVSQGVELISCDIRNAETVENAFRGKEIDVVFHLAARAGVRPSIADPRLYLDTNVQGTFNVLEAARQAGVERFIFASSSSVYGLLKEVPFREDAVIQQTISPYAATKLAAEQLCGNFSHLYGMQMVCLRFFTVYGPRQRPDLAIHSFTRRILEGEPITQFGDGSTRRDYTYIDDIIQGVLAAMDYSDKPFDIFNLGESETTQLSNLIGLLEEAIGRQAEIIEKPEQPGDVPLTCADISKARRLLGYNPTTPISLGIPKYVQWHMEHLAATVA